MGRDGSPFVGLGSGFLVLGVIWWFMVGLKWVVGCDLGFGLEVGFPAICTGFSL